jgi:hypothetical protein
LFDQPSDERIELLFERFQRLVGQRGLNTPGDDFSFIGNDTAFKTRPADVEPTQLTE